MNDEFLINFLGKSSEMLERPIGEGDVTFTRIDGRKVTFNNVRVDSIGPGAENFGVVAIEFYGNDDIVHIPFVESWTVSYV